MEIVVSTLGLIEVTIFNRSKESCPSFHGGLRNHEISGKRQMHDYSISNY